MSPRALRPQNVRRYCIFFLSHEAFGTDADYGTYTSLGMTVEKCKPSERMYRMVSLRKRVMLLHSVCFWRRRRCWAVRNPRGIRAPTPRSKRIW